MYSYSTLVVIPAIRSTQATPSSEALWASIGPVTRSPTAKTPDTNGLQAETSRQWSSPDRHQHFIAINLFAAGTGVKLNYRFGTDPAHAGYAGTQFELDPLLAQRTVERIGHLSIHIRQNLRKHLHHRYLGT